MTIIFWFEFASTYSYPAAMRIEREAEARDIDVVWKPFLLGPIFRAQGWDNSPFNIYSEKGRYVWRDLERICAKAAIPFRRPTEFPRNGLLAARIAASHADAEWLPGFVREVYVANFARDEDIGSPEIVADCLGRVGQSPEPVLAAATSDAGKAQLRANADEAAAAGIFGAPTFTVGDELFWGNDRLEDALDWAEKLTA